MRRSYAIAATLAAGVAIAGPAPAQQDPVTSQAYTFDVQTVVDGLVHPWGLAFLPDGRFLVTERDPGAIRIGTAQGRITAPIYTIPDLFQPEGPTPMSQAGLFDIKLHPDHTRNQLVYWVYSRATDRGSAVVVQRGRLDGDRLGGIEDVWVMDEDWQNASPVHYGGRMAWGADGMLYLTIGDRFVMNRAQDLDDQAGAVLRMTENGEVPPDNPRWDDLEANEYLFTAGHRNIQAITMRPGTSEIWAVEHGPLGGDEVNLLIGGNNHGWPWITGGDDYSGAPIGVGTEREGMTSAIHIFEETVAPSGLAFVHDEPALQQWTGDMLVGGLVAEGLVRVRLRNGAVAGEEWIEIGRRIRDVEIHDGSIWVITEHEEGEVLRLTPRTGDHRSARVIK